MRGYFGGVPATLKVAMDGFINYAFKNLRVGLPGHQKPAENFSWIELDFVTSTTAGQEFSIAHGLSSPPRVAFPCLDLTSSGTQLVRLRTTRAADAKRVYLSSPDTNAAATIFVESRG